MLTGYFESPFLSLHEAVELLGDDGATKLAAAHVEGAVTLIGYRRKGAGLAAGPEEIPRHHLEGAVKFNLETNSLEANANVRLPDASYERLKKLSKKRQEVLDERQQFSDNDQKRSDKDRKLVKILKRRQKVFDERQKFSDKDLKLLSDGFADFERRAGRVWEDVQVAAHEIAAIAGSAPAPADRAGERSPGSHGTQSPAKRRGRRKGVGGFIELDKSLVQEMRVLVDQGDCSSPWNAADAVVERAAGGGEPDAKKKRLVKHYYETFS